MSHARRVLCSRFFQSELSQPIPSQEASEERPQKFGQEALPDRRWFCEMGAKERAAIRVPRHIRYLLRAAYRSQYPPEQCLLAQFYSDVATSYVHELVSRTGTPREIECDSRYQELMNNFS